MRVDTARSDGDRTGVSNFGTELLLTIRADHSIETAITILRRAGLFARDCQRAAWDFAVEFSDLKSVGVTTDEIRWLVGKGIIEHAVEVTPRGSSGRTFDSIGGFTFNNRSCFLLTSFGLQVASLLLDNEDSALQSSNSASDEPNENKNCDKENYENTIGSPSWDADRHELRFQGKLVKQYKGRAANQQAILNAFEEENWAARIDDPLPPALDQNSKRRLSDTIKSLNGKQRNPLIRFSGDGTGEGVIWSVVE